MKILTKLTLALTSTMAINSFAASSAVTQEVDRDTLCNKFPLNSRCEDYKSIKTKSEPRIYQFERSSFCGEFPLNSKCQQPPLQVIKLNLDSSGENDEWVRVEKKANKIKLLHTTRVKDHLVSGVLNGALGFVPFPLPFVEADKHNWEDHQITEVSFNSDRCKIKNCIVTGKDTLTLPQSADIHQGWFTIKYQEKDLKRSLSFRIPADTKPKTTDTITFKSNY